MSAGGNDGDSGDGVAALASETIAARAVEEDIMDVRQLMARVQEGWLCSLQH